MPTASQLVLRAKQLEIESLQALAERVGLVDVLGQLIHALQLERGATSVFLASRGQRFTQERETALAQAQPLEARLRTLAIEQLGPQQGATARTLALMAWALLDLDALAEWRLRIAQPAPAAPSAHEAVAAFSRVIAGLVELSFQLADAATEPDSSRLLVALAHLVQGKEAAGQERALGAQLLASGVCDEAAQQRVIHLIDAQERSLRVFETFANPALQARWQQHQLTPEGAQLERLRRALCTARAGAPLEPALSDTWFALTSARINEMAQFQRELVQALQQACTARIRHAEKDLQDAEGLLRQLRDNPPAHARAVDRFFEAGTPPDAAPALPEPTSMPALVELLQTQSTRLARMEVELDAARRALHERKVIERAKGALMARLGLSEEVAFRTLQKAAMDHNRKLLDVAEAALALPDIVFSQGRTPPQP